MYKILADIVVLLHLCWIIFMLWGFFRTVWAWILVGAGRKDRAAAFFDRWIFRSMHTAGIAFVALLPILNKYCPVTLLENMLRRGHEPQAGYSGSFIMHYVERIVYPDVEPYMIVVPTVIIGLFCCISFVIRPPARVKSLVRRVVSK